MLLLLLSAAAVWLIASASPLLAAESVRPNVVFIISDDQGWNDVGYHGSDVRTPQLDRLARSGVRLDANYVFPTCSPTRAAVLTGRNPSRFGILGPIGGRSEQVLPPETVTLADLLKSAGYRTAMAGKWHLSLRPEAGPRQYGFDSTYGYLHGQVDPYRHLYKNGDRTWQRDDRFVEDEGHATDLITDEAVRVIEARDERPFFLYVAYSVPHYPLEEPEEWLAKYEGGIADPHRRLFAASLTHMDAGIGRIVAALDRSGRRENTLLIFTSDNGGQKAWTSQAEYGGRFAAHVTLGDNKPLRGWKGDLYEGGVRVPGLVNWPGTLQAGSVVRAPVSAMDWYATVAAAARIDLPAGLALDGVNAWPLISGGGSAESGRTLYWKTAAASAVRVGDWKLIEHKRPARHELFHLADDPQERQDLAGKNGEKADALKAELQRQRGVDSRAEP